MDQGEQSIVRYRDGVVAVDPRWGETGEGLEMATDREHDDWSVVGIGSNPTVIVRPVSSRP